MSEPKIAKEAKGERDSLGFRLCLLCFLLFVFLPIRDLRGIRG